MCWNRRRRATKRSAKVVSVLGGCGRNGLLILLLLLAATYHLLVVIPQIRNSFACNKWHVIYGTGDTSSLWSQSRAALLVVMARIRLRCSAVIDDDLESARLVSLTPGATALAAQSVGL